MCSRRQKCYVTKTAHEINNCFTADERSTMFGCTTDVSQVATDSRLIPKFLYGQTQNEYTKFIIRRYFYEISLVFT